MLPLFYPAILITFMFFSSGFEKLMGFSTKCTKFAKKMGLPILIAQGVIVAVILLEILAPSAIVAYAYTGSRCLLPYFKLSLIALAIFTVLATLLYHIPIKTKETYYIITSHVSTIGGLAALYLLA